MSVDMAHFLQHILVLLFLSRGSTLEKDEFISAHVGEKATFRCSAPQTTEQDGVYMYQQLYTKQTVTYFYRDGTFSPRAPFLDRLETNRDLANFVVSIKNLTVQDTGVYWCEFNKKYITSETKKTLLVVSGKQKECDKEEKEDENTTLALIIVCVGAAFLMLFATVILLWLIPRMKHCCERGNFTPSHQATDGVYEDMRGRRPPAANVLINPAYQTSKKHTLHSTY